MKVLWFTNTSSNYSSAGRDYNGGGWISSLEDIISTGGDIQLAVCFKQNNQPRKVNTQNVCYYPVSDELTNSVYNKITRTFGSRERLINENVKKYLEIIKDFSPDVINIFGTEEEYGLITPYTEVPVVIHLQGLINPCLNAFFPPGLSLFKYLLDDLKIFNIIKRWNDFSFFKQRYTQEIKVIKSNQHFIGRTQWDKRVISLYNPTAKYFHVDEVLRSPFYCEFQRTFPSKLIISTTISSSSYKGFDIIVKCANLLKHEMNISFEWCVYGNLNKKSIVKSLIENDIDDCVSIKGVVSAEDLKKAMLNSTVYVHTSYIDNSPNGVCEAQILGCPVIGQYVGGVPSLVNHGIDGFLVPANDPFSMATYIKILYENSKLNEQMGKYAHESAVRRHNKNSIKNDLLLIYKELTLK